MKIYSLFYALRRHVSNLPEIKSSLNANRVSIECASMVVPIFISMHSPNCTNRPRENNCSVLWVVTRAARIPSAGTILLIRARSGQSQNCFAGRFECSGVSCLTNQKHTQALPMAVSLWLKRKRTGYR